MNTIKIWARISPFPKECHITLLSFNNGSNRFYEHQNTFQRSFSASQNEPKNDRVKSVSEMPQRSFSASQNEPKNDRVKSVSEMPGLMNLPIIGSLLSIITKKELYQNKIHLIWENFHKELGPCIKMKFPAIPPAVLFSRPDDVATMYKVTMNNPIRDNFHSLKKVRYEASDNFFEKKGGILVENNDEWWRVRSQVQTPLLRPKNLHRYISTMDEITLEFMDRISSLQKEHGEMPSNFEEELYKWALESVGIVALNRRLGCLATDVAPNSPSFRLIETVNKIFGYLNHLEMKNQMWRLFETPTYRKLKNSHEFLLKIVEQSIIETEANLKAKYINESEDSKHELTLLEILLQKEQLTRKDVITFMLDMFMAGIDTTSHTLAFTLYLLARNPKAQRRLQDEIDSVLGKKIEPIDEKHLAKLSYLKACIKESLRIFPLVIGFNRVLTEDAVIGGYLIPKGYWVVSMSTLRSKDEVCFPRPNEYLPERWLRDKPYGDIHPYASLPFSHGSRMCIGRRIAEQEMYIFLARVMQRFTVDYKYKDFEMLMRLVTVPSEPLKFQFIERG